MGGEGGESRDCQVMLPATQYHRTSENTGTHALRACIPAYLKFPTTKDEDTNDGPHDTNSSNDQARECGSANSQAIGGLSCRIDGVACRHI